MKLPLMKVRYLIIIIISLLSTSRAEDNFIKVTVQNTTDLLRKDEYIQLEIIDATNNLFRSSKKTIENLYTVLVNGKSVPYQLESNSNGKINIGFVTDFNPNEKKTVIIKSRNKSRDSSNFKSRTYAELAMKVDYQLVNGKYTGGRFQNFDKISVPHSHKDHDALFKYEGPGWESELVGYRFYLDQRNSTDIFGKKINKLVLKDVGNNDIYAQDDSYHNMQNWGMDIFNVGSSLGIGTIGMWHDNKVNKVSITDSIICGIVANGPIKSEIKTEYYGWRVGEKKYDLFSSLSITAGSRLTKYDFNITNNPENLVTGLAKFDSINILKSNNKKGWNYIALYGKQSLVKDKLGIAVLFNNRNYIENTEDQFSYIVKFRTINNRLTYYFCAAWEQEPNGIKTEKEFLDYLDKLVVKMNNPIVVK